MENVLVVTNFNAGRKKAVKYKKTVMKFLFVHSKYFRFIELDELDDFDISIFDTIIAMGGDGTVNRIIPYLNGKNLGIIPCGTANLLAANLGISENIKKALKVIEEENTVETDLLDINGNPCVLRCGTGYDADIICRTPQSLKNKFGYFAYFIAGILFSLRLKPKDYVIECDGNAFEVKSSCIIIANAPNMYKNWVSVGVNSKINDGLADIFIFKVSNIISFLYEFLRIVFNIKTDSSRAVYFKTDRLKIRNKSKSLHIDGEKKLLEGDIEVSIRSKSVKIFGHKTLSL